MTYEFYKEIAFSVFIAGIIAVVLGAGIAWLAYDIDRHVENIQKSLAEIQARKDAEGNLVLLRGQASQASGYVPFLISILPDPDTLISVPRDITVKARLYGLDFGFTFGASTKGATTTASTIAYTMTGKGPIDKWLDFLRAFEAGTLLASVETATFSSTGSPRGEAGGATYETTIHGNIFSQ